MPWRQHSKVARIVGAVKLITTATLLLWLFADPFWVAETPRQWTDEQIETLLSYSPWAMMMQAPVGEFPAAQTYLATAEPIREAEQEMKRRAETHDPRGDETPNRKAEFDPYAEEYQLFLDEFGPTHVILAIRISHQEAYYDADELDEMEKESVMKLAGRKVRMTGYFPPSDKDPFLRIAFPKDLSKLNLSDLPKSLKNEKVRFELYVPGVSGPYRAAEFRLADLVLNGKLEL